MKILILGKGGCGKGTFTKMLAKKFNLEYTSSSEFAFPIIESSLRHYYYYGQSVRKEKLFELRREQRFLWKDLIKLINYADKSTLTRMILLKHSIYDGMRDLEEFQASFHLFDYIFYINADERIFTEDGSMEIRYDPEIMLPVPNNGTEEDLQKLVDGLKLYNPQGELVV